MILESQEPKREVPYRVNKLGFFFFKDIKELLKMLKWEWHDLIHMLEKWLFFQLTNGFYVISTGFRKSSRVTISP